MKKTVSIILMSIGALLLIAAAAFASEKANYEEPPLYTYEIIRTHGMKEEGSYAIAYIGGYYSFCCVERREGELNQNYYYCFGEDPNTGALFLFAAEEEALRFADASLAQGQPYRVTGILHPSNETAYDKVSVHQLAIEAAPAAGVSVDEATFPFLFGSCYLCVGEEPQPPARPVAALLIAGAALAAAGIVLLFLARKKVR